MVLTLSAISLRDRLKPGDGAIPGHLLPRYVADEFGLNGLHLQSSLLRGWEVKDIDALRDQADKAVCPILLLQEDAIHKLGDIPDDEASLVQSRMSRVLRVAHRLGCPAVAMSVDLAPGEDDEELLADQLKRTVHEAERLEINLLIAPAEGYTSSAERLTTLIRRVGGFRIGSLPSLAAAAATGDAPGYLRALTPYASSLTASVGVIDEDGTHSAYDMAACIAAIRSVGFDGTMGIECSTTADVEEQITRAKTLIEGFLEVVEA